ncbi:hypothetical protein D6D19_06217 [Aureobasidium pullulans]|uniref:Uncharacterized protein n=1 Tax=Aureobasidium pullulans TaxID=5580 RepID=A0A4S9WE27_AURPU|nr:hypothetical protein D6D28_02338 [Aureobasidium pullulans]THW72778.1 hypothetical protein D6D19_06217 [Aureobasidium pullulans]THY21158.1 hypothetical protein D6D00_07345 [Aureobasidium pullulans]THZ14802.1 hypothetical protein D6C89_10004 [Aureobasidium pullulans]THZ63540.1 hypothetical protein D6C85_08921 [Aureobasidium pullulans]
MSLADLEPNSLHVVLHVRSHPPKANDFHWGLYLHRDFEAGGTKYHVKGADKRWLADHGTTRGVFKSFLLIGLCQVARIPSGLMKDVDAMFRTYDHQLNEMPGLTCRTWVFRVLELLQKPHSGQVLLECNDLTSLEYELLSWGNANALAAADCQQPRPTHRSDLCGL